MVVIIKTSNLLLLDLGKRVNKISLNKLAI